ncbi:MAG: tetraacyldisaccharide 4'-kinase [Bacillota bacterium]
MNRNLQEYLLNLIQKQNFTPGERVILSLLEILEFTYSVLVHSRNFLYDQGILPVKKVETSVVSVGNLTVGGTGKTPVVEKLAAQYTDRGQFPAVILRGYRAEAERPAVVSDGQEILLGAREAGDEAFMLACKLPGVPVVIGKDRYRAAQLACQEFSPDVILLDDGFQHRRLARDRDILVLDGTRPFGYQHLLPRGLLREPLSGFKRAQQVIINHCRQINPGQYDKIKQKVRNYNPDIEITGATYQPCHLELPPDMAGDVPELNTVRGKKVLAVAGIGNPRSFARDLQQTGFEVSETCFFPDHHQYTRADGKKISAHARSSGLEWIITTEKDMVKMDREILNLITDQGLQIFVLISEIKFLAPEEI